MYQSLPDESVRSDSQGSGDVRGHISHCKDIYCTGVWLTAQGSSMQSLGDLHESRPNANRPD